MNEAGCVTLLWIGSLYLPNPRTTNNYAELRGLLMVLQRVSRLPPGPILVIGDSALILRLIRTRTPPKTPGLQALYTATRQVSDRLPIREWRHHFRRHNKMSDAAGNYAMDMRATAHVMIILDPNYQSHKPLVSTVGRWLDNDVQPWRDERV